MRAHTCSKQSGPLSYNIKQGVPCAGTHPTEQPWPAHCWQEIRELALRSTHSHPLPVGGEGKLHMDPLPSMGEGSARWELLTKGAGVGLGRYP